MSLTSREVSNWSLRGMASICSLAEAAYIVGDWRAGTKNIVIGLTSGGYSPVHPGHISQMQDSKAKISQFHYKAHGLRPWIEFIVAVNGSRFLESKCGYEFMPLKARCQIISSIRGVDMVIAMDPSDPEDMTVCEVLQKIRPNYFTKGGDRIASTTPEDDIMLPLGIQGIYGCGDNKEWSSSSFLSSFTKWLRTHSI